MGKQISTKYIYYFIITILGITILYTGIINSRILKKVKTLNNTINETKNLIKGNSCELFSEAVGICNNKCTLTACEQISTTDFLKPIITNNLKTLEIGPYCSPQLKGDNVKYFDVLDEDEIKNQLLTDPSVKSYLDLGFLSNTPHIDYVSPHGDLGIIQEKFDIIFSSHNIEHQIDLITHLNQVTKLLENKGKFYLIIPDKRYCFDHFIAESPLSDILGNHYSSNQKTHPLNMILAGECEATHNNATLHWQGDHGYIDGKNTSCYIESTKKFIEKKDEYINVHRWRFTPQHFEFIINELHKLGLISLKVEKVYITKENTQEFKAILYKP